MASVLRATLATQAFTLQWQHSVQTSLWEEDYRVEGGKLVLTQSRVECSGAGMEPAPDAKLVDGTWRWHPSLAPLSEIRITSSPFTSDYRLCWNGACKSLREVVHSDGIEVVTVAPCAG